MIGVAVLGYGTVGRGTVCILRENAGRIAREVEGGLTLRHILVRRDFPDDPNAGCMVRDFGVIEADPSVQVVVEVMGGTDAAYTYTRRALEAGKCVVTANKELVAAHGLELLEIARAHNVCYLFEAAVGGGIPVLRPLTRCLAANEIDEICGILNGTTNYILTQMLETGTAFADALADAQAAGYAEADPGADIRGLDSARKICILADLAFGANVDPALVSVQGITDVTPADVQAAKTMGCRVKLVARAIRGEDGTVTVWTAPHLVPESNPLSAVGGVMNAVNIHGNAVGWVTLSGPGAGMMPTGSAVVADVMDAALNPVYRPGYAWQGRAVPGAPESLVSPWYVRPAGGEPYITAPMDRAALTGLGTVEAAWRVLA